MNLYCVVWMTLIRLKNKEVEMNKFYFYAYETERNKFGNTRTGSGIWKVDTRYSSGDPADIYNAISEHISEKQNCWVVLTDLKRID